MIRHTGGTHGDHWQGWWRFGRCQLSFDLYHHQSLMEKVSDRWVFKPGFIYDRKAMR